MRIPLSCVNLTEAERTYAKQAIDAGWISGTGEYLRLFESGVARKINRKHVIAVANGTVAVELALRALQIGFGDEVIVPALTFVAPAAAVRSVGATPVLADVCPHTWTIDPVEVKKRITGRTRLI